MSTYLRTALPLLLVGAFTSAVVAQGREPSLSGVKFADGSETTVVPIGGAVYLEGRELFEQLEPPKDKDGRPIRKGFDPFEGLEVSVDSQKCMVLASTLERITIQIHPSVKPGKRKTIKVAIKGRGDAKVKIDILTMKDWEKSERGKAEGESEAGGSMDEAAEQSVLQKFQIEKFTMVKGGAGQTFQISGKAQVPDGLKIELTLMYGKRQIRQRSIPVQGEKFNATFGPYTEKLLVGNYACELVFSINKQSKRHLRNWLKSLPRKHLAFYKRIVRRGYTSVGGTGPQGDILPEDRKRQEEELQNHVKQVTTTAQTLMDQLNEAYAGAARSFFKDKGASSYDKDKYLDWLVKSGYAKDKGGAERIERDTAWASSRGHFDDAAWSQFGRDKLIPALAELVKANDAFNQQYIAPPNAKADELSQFLVSNVAKLFEKRTNDLYQRSRTAVPNDIRNFPFSVMSAPQVSRKYFLAKKRELLRTVGLEPGSE